MKTTRYIMSEGLAFGEETDMKKLQLKSKEGWHLEKFAFMGYTLKKGEPAEYIYNIDYRELEDEEKDEYLNLFAEAGWTHVLSSQGMHFFRAAPGTKPIFTDQESIAEKHHNFGKPLVPIAGTVTLLSILAWIGVVFSSGILQRALTVIAVILIVLAIPSALTLLTIYKNKWIAEDKRGLIRFTSLIPYLTLFLSALIIFVLSDYVHDSLRFIAYIIFGAAIGMGTVSLLQQFITARKVNKIN